MASVPPDAGVVEALAEQIRPGMRVLLADGAGGPTHLLPALALAAERCGPIDLLLGWCLERPAALDSAGFSSVRGFVASDGAGPEMERGTVEYVPVRLSSLPALFIGPWRADLLLVSVASIDGGLVLGSEASWIPAAIETAGRVLVHRDQGLPPSTALGPQSAEDHVLVCEEERGPLPVARPRPTPADLAIGARVAAMLPDHASVQFGPGVIGEALLDSVDRPVKVWSGVITDALVDLDERGLLDGVVGSYAIGTERLWDWCRRRRPLDRLERTHDPARLRNEAFVAVNTALEIDLTGQVNVEAIGGRRLGAVGGHPDFAFSASVAPRGISVIALPTTRGRHSTLVEALECPATTPRYDIDIVVNENGGVDLRGRGENERSLLLEALWDSQS